MERPRVLHTARGSCQVSVIDTVEPCDRHSDLQGDNDQATKSRLKYVLCFPVCLRVSVAPGGVRHLPEWPSDEPARGAGAGAQLRSRALPATPGHLQRGQHGGRDCAQLLRRAGHQLSVPRYSTAVNDLIMNPTWDFSLSLCRSRLLNRRGECYIQSCYLLQKPSLRH